MKKYLRCNGFVWMLFLVTVAFISQPSVLAQTVTGTVTASDDGTPLPGVNILLKGTRTGTVTNLDGYYSINVRSNSDTLIYSYVGYEDQEIAYGGRSVIDVVLQVETEMIDEIVVIGYGTVKKDDLTGSVAVVTSEDLTKTPASDFGKALQGRATGVVVTQNGNPASGASIRIRGIGSINSGDAPLIVIDGVISGKMSSVAPEDIESLQVLKDASATAIYGANGANGVIIITTKRGTPGKTNVSFSAYGKINRQPRYYDVMNASEYAAFYDTMLVRNGQIMDPAYSDGFRQYYYGEGWEEGTDWQREILQDSKTQNYFLRVSGGGENSNYSVSTNYYNDEGILINNRARRYSVRANSDFKLGKFINVGTTTLVARRETKGGSSGQYGAWTTSLYVSPLMRVHVEDPAKGYYPLNGKEGWEGPQVPFDYEGEEDPVNNTGWNDKGNPVSPLAVTDNNSVGNTILTSIYAEIKPFDWLTYRIYPSVDLSMNQSRSWTPAYDNGVRTEPQASLSVSASESMTLSLENQITLAHAFGSHNFTLTGVNHVRKGQYIGESIDAPGFIYEQLPVIDQSDIDQRVPRGNSSEWAQNSYLARLIYDYRSKYLLTASIRRDGSSNFGPENKWGTFPSFSAAWKLNQDLLPGVEQINSLKLRAGWGKTGNSNIGSFRYQNLLGRQDEFSPVFGVDQHVAQALNEMYIVGNPLIKWEAAAMTNIGVDVAAFGNRIQFSAEWYYKKQHDLLMQVPITWTLAKVAGGSVGRPCITWERSTIPGLSSMPLTGRWKETSTII